MDKAEAPKGPIADVSDELARRTRTAASRRIFFRLLSLRHRLRACHSELVTANVATQLIQHYVDNFRRLPWRAAPGESAPDPYRVWLSEVMLQQTTVATVIPRFERFVARWPTIEALAAATDEEILSEWAGLGYYARARNLIACVREVARRGVFPSTSKELRELPGIGAYTAAAIAAIAFGEPVPAVDTNVERVIARVNGLTKLSRAEIERFVLEIMPADRPGDFVQAMMDLGATICRPKKPHCGRCPIRGECVAFASGNPEAFPEQKQRNIRPHKYGVAHWIELEGHVWLVRRPAKGLLGGMTALPGGEWSAALPTRPKGIGVVRHVFTHFSLDLYVVSSSEPIGDGWWHPIERLSEAGLPTLYRKAADIVLTQVKRRAA